MTLGNVKFVDYLPAKPEKGVLYFVADVGYINDTNWYNAGSKDLV